MRYSVSMTGGGYRLSRTVAIVGASANRAKYGNKAVRAYLHAGWTVFPVNPRETTIEGIACCASVRDLPGPVDRLSLYLPPGLGVDLLADIAAARPREFFVNPGAESEDLLNRARELGLAPILACSIVEIGGDPRVL